MDGISLIDLDDSIFQSRSKCPSGIELTGAALNKKQEWHSFCTPQQVAFLSLLNQGGIVVPVTARETDGLRRVQLRFTAHAITSFGAVILLPDGKIEPRWHGQMLQHSRAVSKEVNECFHFLTALSAEEGIDAKVYIISDAGMPLYVNAKHNGGSVKELELLADLIAPQIPSGWKLHNNGNNLAVLPPYLGKEKATAYYLQELAPPHSFVLGLGDSFTDIGFMGLCDYAVTPTRGQIFNHLSSI